MTWAAGSEFRVTSTPRPVQSQPYRYRGRFLPGLTGHVAAGPAQGPAQRPRSPGTDAQPDPGIMEVAGQPERLKPGQAAGHWLADAGRGEPQTAIQRFCARVALSLLA
jgi:hypothetical protein